jgi:hypothetical protein
MVMELEEPFLINYGSKKGVSQWLWIWQSFFSTVIKLEESFLNVMELKE